MDANYLRAANSIGGHHPRKHAVSFYNTNLRHNTRRDNHPFRIHPRASQRHKSETPRAGITFRLSRRPPRRLPSAPSSPLWPCSWRSPFVLTSLEQHRLFRTSCYCTACLSDVHARSFRLIFAAITSLVSRRASSPLPPSPIDLSTVFISPIFLSAALWPFPRRFPLSRRVSHSQLHRDCIKRHNAQCTRCRQPPLSLAKRDS